ncbi:uncharacterized protein LOC121942616 isoform X1 [Plectropomus leopardus]|uniref:uncharacterized protein LOC121942616 isoform X1 n=1 Tax=Plectropomus leopardus TaxID=160734 RepID=UPI001C4C3317|nr:uncharacterized protein LOC121942616 isoform X1 [Plectropomus leopardus]
MVRRLSPSKDGCFRQEKVSRAAGSSDGGGKPDPAGRLSEAFVRQLAGRRDDSCFHECVFTVRDLRRSGLDPGGVHAGGAAEPSGLGHVCLRLLLHHHLHLAGGVRLRGAPQQGQLGRSRLCVSRHRSLLLPQRLGGFGQSDPGNGRRDRLPKLQAGHRCGGLLVHGDAPLLHPHHPVCHPVEIFLEVSGQN